MRALLPLLLTTLVLWGGTSLVAAQPSASERRALALRLDLPASPHDYESERLPAHFASGRFRRPDNAPRENRVTNAGALLGRVLFYDPLLSASGTVSCGSCHQQEHAFAERSRVSRGVRGRRGTRNSMSLVNLRFHPTDRYFWDERAASLEEQVLQPIQDPREMAMPLDQLADRVALRPEYAELFHWAFGDERVTNERIGRALGMVQGARSDNVMQQMQ